MNLKYLHVLIELAQLVSVVATAVTAADPTCARWVTITAAAAAAVATWAKQQYGNTPQNNS